MSKGLQPDVIGSKARIVLLINTWARAHDDDSVGKPVLHVIIT